MKFGLTPDEFSFLSKNLILPLKQHGARVYIFGSRATGTHKKFSDVDLLFKDTQQRVPQELITNLITTFEESQFAYKIDLVNDRQLAESYRENIERSMVEL